MQGLSSSRRVAGLLATIVTGASLALSGCEPFDSGGGQSEIPPDEGDRLMQSLDNVRAATDCESAQAAAAEFVSNADAAAADLDADVEEPLTQGAQRVQQLATNQYCSGTSDAAAADSSTTETTTSTTTSSTATTEKPTKPETEPPADEEQPEPPEEPQVPETPEEPSGEEPQAPPSDSGSEGSGTPDGGVGAPTGGTGAKQGGP